MLRNSLFGAVKFIANADPGKYNILAMVLDLMQVEVFLLSDGSGFAKNVIVFGADMSSFVHIDNKKKDILILVEVQH